MNPNESFTWDDVRRIADELELKIHLASMDARDRWKELQPKLVELEHAIERKTKRAGEILSDQLSAMAKAMHELRDEVVHDIDTRTPPKA